MWITEERIESFKKNILKRRLQNRNHELNGIWQVQEPILDSNCARKELHPMLFAEIIERRLNKIYENNKMFWHVLRTHGSHIILGYGETPDNIFDFETDLEGKEFEYYHKNGVDLVKFKIHKKCNLFYAHLIANVIYKDLKDSGF